MTREQLQKGNELSCRIDSLQKEQSKWERAERISNLEVESKDSYNRYYEIGCKFINFEELKLLVIAKIQKEITRLQNEFNSL